MSVRSAPHPEIVVQDVLSKANAVKILLFFHEASVSLSSLDKMSFSGEHMIRKGFSVTSNHVILKAPSQIKFTCGSFLERVGFNM